jgi:hypothetical protein
VRSGWQGLTRACRGIQQAIQRESWLPSSCRMPRRPREANRPPTSNYLQRLVVELGDLRERGLMGIDDDEPKRKRKALTELTRMAHRYCLVKGLAFDNRIGEIGKFLQDALDAYTKADNAERAAIISRLLFEPSATKSPHEVLHQYKEKEQHWSDNRWKSEWEKWRRHFAAFLIEFVRSVESQSSQADVPEPMSPLHAFAWGLRRLRQQAGNPLYAEMQAMSWTWMDGEKVYVEKETFENADGGDTLPAWITVEVYVKTCGGDPVEWRLRWENVRGWIEAGGLIEEQGTCRDNLQ